MITYSSTELAERLSKLSESLAALSEIGESDKIKHSDIHPNIHLQYFLIEITGNANILYDYIVAKQVYLSRKKHSIQVFCYEIIRIAENEYAINAFGF